MQDSFTSHPKEKTSPQIKKTMRKEETTKEKRNENKRGRLTHEMMAAKMRKEGRNKTRTQKEEKEEMIKEKKKSHGKGGGSGEKSQ